jgi:4-methylaminobutanoate oxidase (formaldehyde-forming)
MGGYERDPAPWSLAPSGLDAVPADFNARTLPLDWERFEQIAENSRIRVPAMADAGIRLLVNGPEAFTPDNEFCLGETDVAGFYVAAGFCAHGIAGAGGVGQVMAEWILDGEPGLDVWHLDVHRFGPAYRSPSHTLARTIESYATYYDIAYPDRPRQAGRPLRASPAYSWHAGHGAEFGEKAGWERVDWYAANAPGSPAGRDLAQVRPRTWAGRRWSAAIGVEHRGPARRSRCSTRRRSRRSRSPGRTPPSCWSGRATTGSPGPSARSPTPRCSTPAAGSRPMSQ